ncbi:MAG: CARDB domain-containing protein [Candidatus Thermoplasmatota archaeon]
MGEAMRSIFIVAMLLVLPIFFVIGDESRQSGVDLYVGDIILIPGPQTAMVGSNITINATIWNIGNENASDVAVIFSRTDEENLTSVTIAKYNFQQNITNGSKDYAIVYWNTSGLKAMINYTINVTVLNSSAQVELNWSNNTNYRNISLLPEPKADPYVCCISASKYEAYVGEAVLINVTIRNKGDADAIDEPLLLYLDENTTPFFEDRVDIGLSLVYTYTWDTTNVSIGNHTIKAKIRETYAKTKNITILAIPQKLFPDIKIVDIYASPSEPEIGEIVKINVRLENVGLALADESELAIYIGNEIYFEKKIPKLEPTEKYTAIFDWNTSNYLAITYTIRAYADFNNIVEESNETNNVIAFYVKLKGSVDLIIYNLTFNIEGIEVKNATIGKIVKLSASVRNIGTIESGNTNITFYIDGKIIGEKNIQILAVSGEITKDVNWDTSSYSVGKYKVKVVVDEKDFNKELNEENNFVEGEFTLLPAPGKPDLTITNLTASNSKPKIGDKVQINVTVMNIGTENAYNVIVGFFVQTRKMSENRIDSILQNEKREIVFTWDTANFVEGNYFLNVSIDITNAIVESNEENNLMSIEITLSPGPKKEAQIEIKEVSILEKKLIEDDTITIKAVLYNNGTMDAYSVHVIFLVDKIKIDEGYYNVLINEEKEVKGIWNKALPGKHNLTVLVRGQIKGNEVFEEIKINVEEKEKKIDLSPLLIPIIIFLILLALVLIFRKPREKEE